MSLDGFIAGPQDEIEHLHDWIWDARSNEHVSIIEQSLKNTGAVVMGKRTFDIIDNSNTWVYPNGAPFHLNVFVLTHQKQKEQNIDLRPYTFVSKGIKTALKAAHEKAGSKNIFIMGADVTQQFIKAGLVDEIQVHLIPILLGKGKRLFEHLGNKKIELQKIGSNESAGVTHLKFRVIKNY